MILSIMVARSTICRTGSRRKFRPTLHGSRTNGRQVFRDIGVGTMTVFSNLTANIKNAMGAIWEFIKSGGTSGLEFTWTPLLDGFNRPLLNCPDILTSDDALEQGMQNRFRRSARNLARFLRRHECEASAAMAPLLAMP